MYTTAECLPCFYFCTFHKYNNVQGGMVFVLFVKSSLLLLLLLLLFRRMLLLPFLYLFYYWFALF